jgi:hypothetical protein
VVHSVAPKTPFRLATPDTCRTWSAQDVTGLGQLFIFAITGIFSLNADNKGLEFLRHGSLVM